MLSYFKGTNTYPTGRRFYLPMQMKRKYTYFIKILPISQLLFQHNDLDKCNIYFLWHISCREKIKNVHLKAAHHISVVPRHTPEHSTTHILEADIL